MSRGRIWRKNISKGILKSPERVLQTVVKGVVTVVVCAGVRSCLSSE